MLQLQLPLSDVHLNNMSVNGCEEYITVVTEPKI